MKKVKILFIALFAIMVCSAVTSCSKDDDEPKAPAYDIIGTWLCTESNWTEDTNDYGYHNGFEVGNALRFFSNGRASIGYSGLEDLCTESEWELSWGDSYTLEGDFLTIMEDDLDRQYGTIVIEGNTMTFTYQTEDWQCDGEYPDGTAYGHLVIKDPRIHTSVFTRQ